MPGLPIGNYYASLGNKYAYFYAAHCVNENPASICPFTNSKICEMTNNLSIDKLFVVLSIS